MKNKFPNKAILKTVSLSFILLLFLTLPSCKKIEREAKVETGAISDITTVSARATSNIIDLGEGITDHGHCWSVTSNPTINDSKTTLGSITKTGPFTSELLSLQPGTNYYLRAYARSGDKVVYGSELLFSTNPMVLATVTTTPVTSITSTTAVSGGNISSDGGGAITARGICWSTNPNPTIPGPHTNDGSGTGSFTSNLTALTSNTTYYVRAYATNTQGTSYGQQINFNTLIEGTEAGKFTDSRDGNDYNWIQIGNQIWMSENMKYLPAVSPPTVGSYTDPYYYVHGYEGTSVSSAKSTSNYNTYGVLYNWPAAMAGATSSIDNPSGVQGVCPSGWHLPSIAEWIELISFLGGGEIAGGKMKEAGYTHWISPNTGATNSSGFTALPGDSRGIDDRFYNIGYFCNWWSTWETETTYAAGRGLQYNEEFVGDYGYPKASGVSVRCIKD